MNLLLIKFLDEGLKEFVEKQHHLEDICFKRLNTQFTQTFVHLKSPKLTLVDLSYSAALTDKGILKAFLILKIRIMIYFV